MDPGDLAFAGVMDQAQMLAAGELTAPDLLEVYLERIARLDPQLRCYRVVLAGSARPGGRGRAAPSGRRRAAAAARRPGCGQR